VNGWKVELSPSARAAFRRLDDAASRDAADLIQELREDGPALAHAIQLRGNPNTWRVRFHHDRYRMIYQFSRSRKHILVTRIRLRANAYEGMKR
jgi:mRNA-degrading endonuclease RelE of RelBE toxin-antitoxin system